jgi:3-hydroxyacyl-[acyl-carrier-protein] dehydratase
MIRQQLSINVDHPAFSGHFPSRAIVPGVVLLDLAKIAIEKHTNTRVTGIAAAKFVSSALPGEVLCLDYEFASQKGQFRIRCADRMVASGRFTF